MGVRAIIGRDGFTTTSPSLNAFLFFYVVPVRPQASRFARPRISRRRCNPNKHGNSAASSRSIKHLVYGDVCMKQVSSKIFTSRFKMRTTGTRDARIRTGVC